LEEPDSLPIGEIIINPAVMEKVLGSNVPRFFNLGMSLQAYRYTSKVPLQKRLMDFRAFSRQIVDCYRKLGFDYVGALGASIMQPIFDPDGFIVDEWGTKYRWVSDDDWPFYISGPLRNPDDIDKLSLPDGSIPERFTPVETIVKENKDMAVCGVIPGAFFGAWSLCGFNGFITDLFLRPNLARKLLHLSSKYCEEIGKGMIDAGVDFICLSHDVAFKDGPMISPKLFREFCTPYLKRMVNSFHSRHVPVVLHSDGNIEVLLDEIVGVGVDGIHSIEPSAGMNIGIVKQEYGDRLCLMGNIDLSYTLSFGTLEEVCKEVEDCIKAAGCGGGYILGSCNSLNRGVRLENVLTMIGTGRRLGRYPA
jgi:uroporphyrinogen decarboxylase